ncbi:MAG: sulfate adenylyltransferase subunit 1 [Lautropia sp.]
MKRDLFVPPLDGDGPGPEPAGDRSPQASGVLRFITCGSVDDGKSTLIGRLLYDSKALLADTLATLDRHARERGLAAPDLALLTDGLIAEREQGITIDVAYRYFATPRRNFIIADCPGHEQYTRNMVTAASTADLAVLLVDARKGLLPQTFRHAALVTLLGVRRLVLAVNKMDLVGHSQPVFDRIAGAFRQWLKARPEADRAAVAVDILPISALGGDMVAGRGDRLAWYDGSTLLQLLEDAEPAVDRAGEPLRLPIQWVCRPVDGGPRGYAGRIESGRLSVGDEVIVWPSGMRSRIARIWLGDRTLASAGAGRSVTFALTDERDVSRGDLLLPADAAPGAARTELAATLCWLATEPLAADRHYRVRHMTRDVKSRVMAIESLLDVARLTWSAPAPGTEPALGLNDIARVRLRLQQPIWAESYGDQRAAGRFLLIDPDTQATVAAGLID